MNCPQDVPGAVRAQYRRRAAGRSEDRATRNHCALGATCARDRETPSRSRGRNVLHRFGALLGRTAEPWRNACPVLVRPIVPAASFRLRGLPPSMATTIAVIAATPVPACNSIARRGCFPVSLSDTPTTRRRTRPDRMIERRTLADRESEWRTHANCAGSREQGIRLAHARDSADQRSD